MSFKLDLKDRRLLYELDLDCKQTYNELAKKIGLSKTAVLHRVNNLKKEGVIRHFQTIIDIGKLGYTAFRLYLKFQSCTPEKKDEIISYLQEKKIIAWIVSVEGEYDLGALIQTKSIDEINVFWIDFIKKYRGYLNKRFLAVMTKVRYFSRAYLLDLKENNYEIDLITTPDEKIIDEKDKEILQLLVPDARTPITTIAHKVGLTPKIVVGRIKRLEEKKIIRGYKIVPDLKKIGYKYFKVHFQLNNLTNEQERTFRQYVKNHPNIIYDNEVLGGDDFEIEVQVKGLDELRTLIEKIYSQCADIIKEHKILEYYKEHKFLFLPGQFNTK